MEGYAVFNLVLTFNDYAKVVLAKWFEIDKSTSRTVESHEAILRHYILPVIGEEYICLLDNANVKLQRLIRSLVQVPVVKTRRNRICVLRRLLYTAQKDGFLREVPSSVARLSVAKDRKPKKAEQKDIFDPWVLFDVNDVQIEHCRMSSTASTQTIQVKNCQVLPARTRG